MRWGEAARAAGWGLAGLLLFVAGWTQREHVGVEFPDAGWGQTVNLLVNRGARFGVDTVFPYGPLGPLLTSADDPDPAGAARTHRQALVLHAWSAALVVLAASRLSPAGGVGLVALSAFVPLANLSDAPYQVPVLAAAWLPLRAGRLTAVGLLLGPPYLALLGLAKFNFLVQGAVCLAVVATAQLFARPRWHAAVPGGVFAVSLLAGWVACGQRLSDLPAYLSAGLEYVRGYADGMALPGPVLETRLGLAVLGLLLAGVLATGRPLWRPQPLGVAGLLLVTAGLAWKYGFVRQDIHAVQFFTTAGALALLVPLVGPADSPRLRGWLLGLAGGVSALGGYEVCGRTNHFNGGLQRSLVEQIDRRLGAAVLDVPARRQVVADRRAAERAARDLPLIRSRVGDAPVDVLTDAQGVALLNGLNLRPRPTIQSANACDGPMLRRNAAYLAGPEAPPFVLLDWQTWDRYPTMCDGPALLEVLRCYRPVLAERGLVLCERLPAPPPPATGRVVADRVVRTGEPVEVAAAAGELLTARIDFGYTALGELRKLAFRPPEVLLGVRDDAGVWTNYRLYRGMAGEEFLLDPICHTTADLRAVWGDAPGRRATAVRVSHLGAVRKFVRPDIRITVAARPRPEAPTETR